MSAGTFTFLHAADLHLGSPFLNLSVKDQAAARRFASASRDAFRNVVDAAIEAKAAFAVIAGDIYDGEWHDSSIGHFFIREVSRLHRAQIPAFIVRGNHDAESEVFRSLPLPETVRQFRADHAESFGIDGLKVMLHGRSYPMRDTFENLAATYPAPVDGWFNIGILHTGLTGRGEHQRYAPCTVDELMARSYDYWALGHVHEYEEVNRDPWIVFPGNLQGRSVRECGAKGAVLVDVRHGRVEAVRRVIADRARWAKAEVALDGIADEAEVLNAARRAIESCLEACENRPVALRVRLNGATDLHRRLVARRDALFDEIQAVAGHLHGDIWIEKLEVATREQALTAQAFDALAGIDIEAALAEIAVDGSFHGVVRGFAQQVKAKLPGGIEASALDDVDALLADATALVLGRIAAAES
jgi:exonuclease SbcD